MPIYEYKCQNGHVFDVMQRMSDDPLEVCIKCDASVRKVMQPVGISFKGSGFYSTDYSGASQNTPPGESNVSKNGSSDASSSQNGDSKSSSSEKAGSATGASSGSSSGASGD
ncbi:putative regulatory protein, FmdB family [Rubrobacter radiotolerans]|uniref:FmdB family zinc ribbon protein n=1 Tax=Rubrobacter radiotolerans TaxID=42256 RepID=A0A023X285_RUBRA|nr:FmdB family zinc ribbon protein [Rubrobacter radiotolerans]AHY46336.1 putative regulatory protein, FmdB family [Rubrobacter radiotolerans]MDX5893743.1 FmdB family zinc ribbon protein [Rubrobacter radiotolerans]SMC04408.1 putative regulatory protein, FmdB family [Rubrobacter radiotolerans DSM 5868]